MKMVITKNRNNDKIILKSVPMEDIKITGLMGKYLQRTVDITIPSQYEILEQTGRINNFRVCSKMMVSTKGLCSTIQMFINGWKLHHMQRYSLETID